jgi:prefoldin subunit 5
MNRDIIELNSDMDIIIAELKALNDKLRELNASLSLTIKASESTLSSLKTITECLN